MRLALYKVKGESMVPALSCGDFVLSLARASSRYKVGDIVVVRHHLFGTIVKRVQSIDSSKRIKLIGDSPRSTSSDDLGWQEPQKIIGRVIWRIATSS